MTVLHRIGLWSTVLCCLIFWCSCVSAAENWQHPGVLISKAQLDFVKQQVTAHTEPFYTQFLKAQRSPYGSKTYTMKGPWPGGVIQCGYYSKPDNGCSTTSADAAAAYVQALLWYLTEDPTYAKNAIAIMNAYSSKLKGFAGFTPGYACPSSDRTTCANAPLQAAWDAEKWPRAAEIIRYGHGGSAGWAPANIAAFSNMLKNIYQPMIYKGSASNGNWELSMIEAMMGIAVFNEDLSLLRRAQQFWRERVPAYFYNYALDNPLYPGTHAPFPTGRQGVTTWNGQTVFNATTTGVTQETCRDLGHTEFGIAAAINAAETDYIQGGTLTANLYTANGAATRLITSLNQTAGFELLHNTTATAPTGFCTGAGNIIKLSKGLTYIVAYNAYHNRFKNPAMADASGTSGLTGTANTYNWIQKYGLNNTSTNFMSLYEGITHYADSGSVTPPPPATTIVITANNQTMVQGGTLPALTWSANPAISLSTNPVCATKATTASSPGKYPITCSGAAKTGYTISYVPGTLTVTAAPTGMRCQITSAKITAQVNWGRPTLINKFVISAALTGSSGNPLALTGQLVMKDAFVQNFWGSFALTPKYNGMTGQFSGNLWNTSSLTIEGYIDNVTPLTVGSNPLQSMTLNGVVCQ